MNFAAACILAADFGRVAPEEVLHIDPLDRLVFGSCSEVQRVVRETVQAFEGSHPGARTPLRRCQTANFGCSGWGYLRRHGTRDRPTRPSVGFGETEY